MGFLDEDYLLTSNTAKKLYNTAKKLPVIDYHCHINPKEIAEDNKYENITQVWLYGDHYKWRLMRQCGVDEKYITGNSTDYEKFYYFAKTMENCVGNPVYHWSHLELRKYFDCYEVICEKNSKSIYEHCNKKLKELSVRKIIEMSDVKLICTTDDPADDLNWHKQIQSEKFKVLPTFRPDNVLNIEKDGFKDYINKLNVKDFDSLVKTVKKRLDYFVSNGCVISDHAFENAEFESCGYDEAKEIFEKRLCADIDNEQVIKYRTFMTVMLMKEYKDKGITAQLHYCAMRNNNTKMYEALGPDTGYDSIGQGLNIKKLKELFDKLNSLDALPTTIIYSLNPNDNAKIVSLMGCFKNIYHGSAWWFNDNLDGMEQQIKNYANMGVLGKFLGMLTDSRSFLSYTRHDYFRRLLCSIIGKWVDEGLAANDFEQLENIISNVCYKNIKRVLGVEISG